MPQFIFSLKQVRSGLVLLQFQCTKLIINLREKNLEMATGIRPYQYKPVVDINFGIDWESLSDEEVS